MSSPNQTIEKSLDWRYAVKRFDPARKISAGDWQTLKHSLLKAPSSYGLQPWKFLVVEDSATRAKLREVSWGQSQVTDASHFVVFATREGVEEADVAKYIKRIAEVRGVGEDSLKGFRDMMVNNLTTLDKNKALHWTQRQAYIAMGFLLQSAALLQIDATPMEGLDPSAYDKILGLEGKGWRSVAAVALGYRHAEDGFQNLKKVRFTEDEVFELV